MSAIKNLGTIAVMVPLYNSEPYIHDCLDSLIRQSYPYWVAYVVDDGSPDASGKIADEYAAKDSRFCVFHKQNGGYGSALNYALEQAASSLESFLAVTFLDGDDYLDENAYRDLSSVMAGTQVDILFFGFKRLHSDKRINEREFSCPSGTVTRLSYHSAQLGCGIWQGKNGAHNQIWNKFYKSSLIQKIRFLGDKDYIEDIIFCTKTAVKASSFYFFDKSYYFYRQHEDSAIRSPYFQIRRARSILYSLSIIEKSTIKEKDEFLEQIYPKMFRTFQKMRNGHITHFFENSNLFIEVANKIMPWATQEYQAGRVKEKDFLFLCEVASSQPLNVSLTRHPAIQFVLQKAESLINEKKIFNYAKYLTLRVDIRNKGKEGNKVIAQSIVPDPERVREQPAWLPDGISIESTSREMKVIICCQGKGELDIRLRGRDERNDDRKRYPVWIDCTYFTVNGLVVFSEAKTVCHDKPYLYKKTVIDREIVKLEFRWTECRSSSVLDEYHQLQKDLKESHQKLSNEVKKNKLQSAYASQVLSQLHDEERKNKRQEAYIFRASSQLRRFRLTKYLKYKFLSKVTFGNMRNHYKEKYQEQKSIYKSIKKGRFSL
ncbi:MAG: glycosyltransferase family 2 protein [Oxalobacter sp.]|nr:glycosyltransferase family 2 protein [Oxalobacter sp.]